MYNTTSIIKELLSGKKYPDYRKTDTNGFSPIHYAINSGNYLLVEEMLNKIKNYSLHYVLDSAKITPVSLAYAKMDENSVHPEFDKLNVSYINQLLLSAEINKNISTSYVDLYKILLGNINKFIENNDYDFGGLLRKKNNKMVFNENINISKKELNKVEEKKDKLEIDIQTIATLKPYVKKIDKLILASKPINDEINNLIQQKANLLLLIKKLDSLINIFERKYEGNKLYDRIDEKSVIDSNKYYLLLTSLGVISIYKLITEFYVKIILKKIYTGHAFTDITGLQPDVMKNRLKNKVTEFVKANIFNLVRKFYNIKLDQYEIITESNAIGNFMDNLLNEFSKEGILSNKPDAKTDTIYNDVRQYINTYMTELIKQTLIYNNVILDVVHKWIVNLFYSIKTFYALINPN
jgi:hypothetical protein